MPDPTRGVIGFGGSNKVVAFHLTDEWIAMITCTNPSRAGHECVNGPAERRCLNDNPSF